jgi:hypothetical protein
VWARAYYQQQRQRGNDHHAAVRALAFKWIRIVFRCWKDRVAYDENKYLAALAKRGSPLRSALPAPDQRCELVMDSKWMPKSSKFKNACQTYSDVWLRQFTFTL